MHVYSSLRVGQPVSEQRLEMFDQMRELHYDVHIGSFDGPREKCVDIALAVDMLHYATVQVRVRGVSANLRLFYLFTYRG